MIPSRKLELYYSLGCIPLKDVVLHHPRWELHAGNLPEYRLDFDRFLYLANQDGIELSLEAVPEKLSFEQIAENTDRMIGAGGWTYLAGRPPSRVCRTVEA